MSTALYLIFSAVYLLSFGVFNTYQLDYQLQWHLLVLGGTFLYFLWSFRRAKDRKPHCESLLILLIFVYALMIIGSIAFHHFAISSGPESLWLNTAKIKAADWLQQNIRFGVYYLFFPLLLLLNLRVVSQRGVVWFTRILTAPLVASLVALAYQTSGNPFFVNRPYWVMLKRFGGLATDPNAFSLTAYLALGLLISVSLLEPSKWLKRLYLSLGCALVCAMYYTGNRTVFAGTFLFLLICPLVILALVKTLPALYKRICFIGPFLLIVAVSSFLLAGLSGKQFADKSLGFRLVKTIEKYQGGGLKRVFSEKEARATMYEVSASLITQAPLGGWGPGGFYREYPNERYRQTGNIEPAYDSSLNHYLMIAGDLGLGALCLNILIIGFILITSTAAIRQVPSPALKNAAIVLLVSNAVFLLMMITVPPSYFPGVLWLWTAQLALLAGFRPNKDSDTPAPTFCTWLVLGTLLLLFAVGSFQTSFGSLGYNARQDAQWWPYRYWRNCWDVEKWSEGDVVWCGKKALLSIPAVGDKGVLGLRVKASHPDIDTNPVILGYGSMERVEESLVLENAAWHEIEIAFDSDNLYRPQVLGARKQYAVISLDVSRTWSPKAFELSEDSRELGIAVLIKTK